MAGASLTGSPQPSGPPDADLDNELWRFACSFYSREGVAPACLTLQAELGVDVNILLFAVFAHTRRGILLGHDELGVLDRLVGEWRAAIVQPLRRLRTALKTGPFPAPSPATSGLRDRIKALELEAEQIEVAVLFDWLDRRPAPSSAARVEAADIPRIVAGYFRRSAGDPRENQVFEGQVEDALRTLAQAIRRAGATSPARFS